jgi:hypothetical protein
VVVPALFYLLWWSAAAPPRGREVIFVGADLSVPAIYGIHKARPALEVSP